MTLEFVSVNFIFSKISEKLYSSISGNLDEIFSAILLKTGAATSEP